MSEEPPKKRKGRNPGSRKPKMSPLSPQYKSDRITLTLGEDVRSELMRRALAASMNANEYVKELLRAATTSVALPDALMARLARSVPSGATPAKWAETLIIQALNDRGYM